MQVRAFVPRSAIALLMALVASGGCRESAPQVAQGEPGGDPTRMSLEPVKEAETLREDLPAWLQQRPDGWGDESWYEYQSSLIRLRAPIAHDEHYSEDQLEVCTAEVEHWPGDYEDHIKAEWLEKWQTRLSSFTLTGGCGCCNEVYTVTGPRVAMEEFPNQPGRRKYYPKYLATTEP